MRFKQEIIKDKITINGKTKDINIDTRCSELGQDMLNVLNSFEKNAWSDTVKSVDTGFKALNNMFFNGFPPGFYIIAADSNLGKTSFLTQITHQMLDLNDDIFILDFSLDDSLDDKISRLVGSWVRMDSNEVKFPKNRDEKVIERRKYGMYKLAECVDRYLCHDSTFGSSIEAIEEEIERVHSHLEEGTRLVVMIDSFHDLFIEEEPSLPETPKFNKIAQWAGDISVKYDMVLVCTGEIKKSEKDNQRSTLNSLRESIKIRFVAKAIILLYNDVHYRGDAAEIFFEQKDCADKLPILEVHVAKNKISSHKGRLFYYMWPDKAYFKECPKEVMQKYRTLI